MKRVRLWGALAAAALLLVLALGRPGPPGAAEAQRRLFAHPEMARYNLSTAHVTLLDPATLERLAAAQPAIYGGLAPAGPLYRAEVSGPGGGALVLYDAGSDRILRVFNLLEGRLE